MLQKNCIPLGLKVAKLRWSRSTSTAVYSASALANGNPAHAMFKQSGHQCCWCRLCGRSTPRHVKKTLRSRDVNTSILVTMASIHRMVVIQACAHVLSHLQNFSGCLFASRSPQQRGKGLRLWLDKLATASMHLAFKSSFWMAFPVLPKTSSQELVAKSKTKRPNILSKSRTLDSSRTLQSR